MKAGARKGELQGQDVAGGMCLVASVAKSLQAFTAGFTSGAALYVQFITLNSVASSH